MYLYISKKHIEMKEDKDIDEKIMERERQTNKSTALQKQRDRESPKSRQNLKLNELLTYLRRTKSKEHLNGNEISHLPNVDKIESVAERKRITYLFTYRPQN